MVTIGYQMSVVINYLVFSALAWIIYSYLTFTSPKTFMDGTSVETSEGEGVDSQPLLCISIHVTTN